jgi:hypothetical protein
MGASSTLARVTSPAECQNCGAALAGRYCSACGQRADVAIPSLGRLVGDALGDVFNFDSRLWRSLATLAVHPGRLTNCYLQGQRARYTPPFRMYVITSLTFFVVFSLVRSLTAADEPAVAIDAAAEAAALGEALAADPFGEALGPATPAQEQSLRIGIDDDDLECQVAAEGLSPDVRTRLEAACRRVEDETAAPFGREFADNFPVMMLVFIPIVAAIMKVLYAFSRRKYVEHLLFFVHAHTFFFLIALPTVALWGLTAWVPALEIPILIVGAAAWVLFLTYLYLAMREVYAQGHALTAVKYVVLGGSYFLAALLTLLGGVIVTALTI